MNGEVYSDEMSSNVRAATFLFLPLLWLGMQGCSSAEPDVAEDGTQVEVLEPVTIAQEAVLVDYLSGLRSVVVDPEFVDLYIDGDGAAHIAPSDLLVGSSPAGFLRRVSEIEQLEDGGLRFFGDEAPIQELFVDGRIRLTHHRPFAALDEADAEPDIDESARIFDSSLLPYLRTENRGGDLTPTNFDWGQVRPQCSGNGTISDILPIRPHVKVSPRIVVDLSFRQRRLAESWVGVKADAELGFDVLSSTAAVSYTCDWKSERDVGRGHPLQTFFRQHSLGWFTFHVPVPPIPFPVPVAIHFTYTPTAYASVNAQLSASFPGMSRRWGKSAHWGASRTKNAGSDTYSWNRDTSWGAGSNNISTSLPQAKAKVAVDFNAGVKLGAYIYGTIGPDLDVKAGAKGSTEIGIDTGRNCQHKTEMEAYITGKISIGNGLGIELPERARVVDRTKCAEDPSACTCVEGQTRCVQIQSNDLEFSATIAELKASLYSNSGRVNGGLCSASCNELRGCNECGARSDCNWCKTGPATSQGVCVNASAIASGATTCSHGALSQNNQCADCYTQTSCGDCLGMNGNCRWTRNGGSAPTRCIPRDLLPAQATVNTLQECSAGAGGGGNTPPPPRTFTHSCNLPTSLACYGNGGANSGGASCFTTALRSDGSQYCYDGASLSGLTRCNASALYACYASERSHLCIRNHCDCAPEFAACLSSSSATACANAHCARN